MASFEKPIKPTEVENVEDEPSLGGYAKGTVEFERAQLLTNLPDPDAGKSDEERRAIVRALTRSLLDALVLTRRPRTRS